MGKVKQVGKQFSKSDQLALRSIMRNRRDIRGNRFTGKSVSNEDLSEILESALWAPSVGFSQPWRMLVLVDQAKRQAILENFRSANLKAAKEFVGSRKDLYSKLKLEGIQEASHLVAVFHKRSQTPTLGAATMKETGPYSVVCAIQNMWLMARAKNIGMGWISIIEPSILNSILDVPDNMDFIALLCLGHVDAFPDAPELETLGWEQRRLKDELIFFDTFDS